MKQASQFLSYVVRHKPDAIGLRLDAQGWASIEDLVTLTQGGEVPLSRVFDAGTPFYLSENGVWLTPAVPSEYLIFPSPFSVASDHYTEQFAEN